MTCFSREACISSASKLHFELCTIQQGELYMNNYPISELQPGMRITKTIFSPSGQMILEAGTILTSRLISRLSFYGIASANAEIPKGTSPALRQEPEKAEATAAMQNQSRASNPTYSQKVKAQPEFMAYQIEYQKEVNSLRSAFHAIIQNPGSPIDVRQLLDDCYRLTSLCKTTLDLFDKLHNMRVDKDSVYAHCLNVALIARQMGKWMHFTQEELDILTLCGLFHDIGKVLIPDEILNKPGKYTEEEFSYIQQHPLSSYKLLKNLPIDARIKNAALMHHERSDGSGYPQKLKSEEIDDYAEIIAIADVYDAMTAARSYRSPLCPFQAIDMFEKDGLQLYSPKYILTFLNHIANTYQNNRVLLNNGQSANIVMINPKHLTRPMLQMDDGTVVDMLSLPEWEIIKII